MGSCLSIGRQEGARMEELRRIVDGLSTKEEREKLVLHLLIHFDQAQDGSRDKALATLADVIRLVENAK